MSIKKMSEYSEITSLSGVDLFPVLQKNEDGTYTNKVVQSSYVGGGALTWSVITSGIVAEADHGYFVDASSNQVLITLPTSPVIGDTVGIRALDITSGVVLMSDHNIEGLSGDLEIDTEDFYGKFSYSNVAYGYIRSN